MVPADATVWQIMEPCWERDPIKRPGIQTVYDKVRFDCLGRLQGLQFAHSASIIPETTVKAGRTTLEDRGRLPHPGAQSPPKIKGVGGMYLNPRRLACWVKPIPACASARGRTRNDLWSRLLLLVFILWRVGASHLNSLSYNRSQTAILPLTAGSASLDVPCRVERRRRRLVGHMPCHWSPHLGCMASRMH